MTLRLSYKLSWPESRMVVNKSADWGEEGEINISPDNIEVRVVTVIVMVGVIVMVQILWE